MTPQIELLLTQLRSTSGDAFNRHWELHLRAAELIEFQMAEINRLEHQRNQYQFLIDSLQKELDGNNTDQVS